VNAAWAAIALAGTGMISAGAWRIGSAIYSLASKVDTLSWRVSQVEKQMPGGPPKP